MGRLRQQIQQDSSRASSASLRSKLLIPLALLALIAGAITVWMVHQTSARQLEDQAMRRAKALVNSIHYVAETANNKVELQKYVIAAGEDKDVDLIVVVGGKPVKVQACTNPKWLNKPLSQLPVHEVGEDLIKALRSSQAHYSYQPNSNVFDYSSPLLLNTSGQGAGAVMVHLAANPLRREISRATWQSGFRQSALLLGLILLIYALTSRLILAPLHAIVEAMSRRTSGDQTARAPVRSSDEIGALASTLNSMLDAFDQSQHALSGANAQVLVELEQRKRAEEEVRQLNRDLEQRVKERTAQLEALNLQLEAAAHANQNLMNYSQDVICSIDEGGRFLHVSAACEKVWGYRPEELVGRFYMELVHPDDVARTTEAALQIMSGHTAQDFENRYLRKDGSVVTMLWSAHWSDVERSMFCVARDITERKQVEEALRESDERLRLMLESVQDYAILTLDPQGYITSWNSGAERIKGYRAEEIIGQHFSRFYPAEDIAAGKLEMELEVATAQGRFEEEGWRVRKDGSRFWANVVITAMRDAAGQLRGFSKVTRDITERKEAEEKLAQNERQLLAAQALAHVGSWEWNIATNQVLWSDELYRIFGLTPHQFGATYEAYVSFIHPEDREMVNQIVGQALQEKGSFDYNHRIIRKNGEERIIHARGEVILDAAGQPLKMIGSGQDITEARQLEQELRAAKEAAKEAAEEASFWLT